MANIDFSIVGGVTDTSSVISTKLDYASPTPSSELKLLRIDYDGTNLSTYVNGTLIQSIAKTGDLSFLKNISIGCKGDNSNFFKGYIPEIIFYKNKLSNQDTTNLERWLANKWLNNGTSINGYTVQNDEGSYPSISNLKYLHFDETTIINGSSGVFGWSDKADFGGLNINASLVNSSNFLGYSSNKFKNKPCIVFNGTSGLKVPLISTDFNPFTFSFFIVLQFDDINQVDDQEIIGCFNNDTTPIYDDLILLKKTNTDNFVNFSLKTTSVDSIQIPNTSIYSLGVPTFTYLGKIYYKIANNLSFTNSFNTTEINVTTLNNGIAKIAITGLIKNTKYYYKVYVDDIENTDLGVCSFNTFKVNESFSFKCILGANNGTSNNDDIWEDIKNQSPLFFIHYGNIHGDTISSNNKQLFRDAFKSTLKLSKPKSLFKDTPLEYVYASKDFGGSLDKNSTTKQAALDSYIETIPSYNIPSVTNGIYHSFVCGRIKFIVTDNRFNRDPFDVLEIDDNAKTLLGSVQKQWLKSELLSVKNSSTLECAIWINNSSWLSDKSNPYSWSNNLPIDDWSAYEVERREIHQYILDNNIKNILIFGGEFGQQGIDDGRNSLYGLINGSTPDFSSLDKNILIPVVECSPLNGLNSNSGGPFDINSIGDSGKVFNSSRSSYTILNVYDLGYNWIKFSIEQYALPDSNNYTQKTLINKYTFIRDTKNGVVTQKDEVSNKDVKTISGKVYVKDSGELTKSINIEFITPTSFKNNFKSYIQGRVVNIPLSNLTVKVYRRINNIDVEVGSCPVNNTTGIFLFNGHIGKDPLIFKIYNSINNKLDEIYNDGISSNVYYNLSLNLYTKSKLGVDTLVSQNNLKTTKDYSISFQDNGDKAFVKLVNKSNSSVLSKTALLGNLPKSIAYEGSNQFFSNTSFLRDSGLSLIASSISNRNDLSYKLAKNIIGTLSSDGSVPFFVNHIYSENNGELFVRNKTNALVAYALSFYLQKYPNTKDKSFIQNGLDRILTYLASCIDTGNFSLIKEGFGKYDQDVNSYVYDPLFVDNSVYTETNIYSYFAFKLGSLVLNKPSYLVLANSLKDSITSNLYDSSLNRICLRLDESGNKDFNDSLDSNSLGSIFFVSTNRISYSNYLLSRIENIFVLSSGYKPIQDSSTLPSYSGTFLVSIAYNKSGNLTKYNTILNNIYNNIDKSGGFRNCNDPILEDSIVIPFLNINSTSLAIIAKNGVNSIFI